MALICNYPACDYTRRNGLIYDTALTFCPTCGNRLEIAVGAEGPIALPTPVSRGKRFGAFAIDWIIALIPSLFSIVFGTIPAILAVLYWLLRDIQGASPGKSMIGLVVLNRGGGPSTQLQRILRNVPFALPLLPMIIPFLGGVVGGPLDFLILVLECILVLTTGERLGDKLAGTMVVLRTAIRRA